MRSLQILENHYCYRINQKFHKWLRSQEGGDLFSAEIFRTRGEFFRCRRLHFLVKEHRIFRNLWCARTDKGEGVEPVRTFCGQGREINFSRFCADVLYGRPLMLLGASGVSRIFQWLVGWWRSEGGAPAAIDHCESRGESPHPLKA